MLKPDPPANNNCPNMNQFSPFSAAAIAYYYQSQNLTDAAQYFLMHQQQQQQQQQQTPPPPSHLTHPQPIQLLPPPPPPHHQNNQKNNQSKPIPVQSVLQRHEQAYTTGGEQDLLGICGRLIDPTFTFSISFRHSTQTQLKLAQTVLFIIQLRPRNRQIH